MAKELTYLMLKPDAVRRKLMGEIIDRIEKSGLDILELKTMHLTKEILHRHYAEHINKPFYPELEAFMLSGPVVGMKVSGEDAVARSRELMGPTNPANAPKGTIRGDYGKVITENLIHGSDSVESAKREIAIFFGE